MAKPYLTYAQQIQKLRDDKGLIINDGPYAERMLTDIPYIREGGRTVGSSRVASIIE